MRMLFGAHVPELQDVVVRGVELETRGAGPRALVTIEFFDLPVKLPAKWESALTGLMRMTFDGVSSFALSGWPSDDRSALHFATSSAGVEASFLGALTNMSVIGESLSVDRLQGLRG
ncbi:hypothetical protein [Actinomycetospora sp. CA-084318]|uniref:hypothetical protein n=1 Tax=Actinomycetospora sp. CA-084318 TaxID=3239892 RepID=UPI003D99651C